MLDTKELQIQRLFLPPGELNKVGGLWREKKDNNKAFTKKRRKAEAKEDGQLG